jgi:lipoprotein NlpD
MIQKNLKMKQIRQFKQLIQVTTLAAMLAVVLQLTGCSSPMPSRAPVEDRNPVGQGSKGNQGNVGTTGNSGNVGKPINDAPVLAPIDSKPLPNITNSVNAGKPGYYTVKPGDTIFQVGRVTGQNAKDIIRWNNLENPNQIEAGQVLRVAPPEGSTGVVTPAKPPAVTPATPATPATPLPPTASTPSNPPTADDDIAWIWPNGGSVICAYDETCRGSKNKGLQIAGKAGDPVFASADGRVVYAGSAVRGYGNLVILKHNETYLTAYAHNQTLLVKEDQTVRKGQRIADMGSTDAERVMLGFEVRRLGKPVDPAKYLPGR